MDVLKGEKGLDHSWQDSFPKKTKCGCGSIARIAFVAQEIGEEDSWICDLHDNEGRGGFWPHDAIAVAVYFCKECFEPVTLWNQA